ncbi:hypothetical protein ULF88_01050 [Halopseudomonas pachastrellae]|nr:hypothetical protein [Halopseudomonas pachastrellae]
MKTPLFKLAALTLGVSLSSVALATNPGGGGGGSNPDTGTGFPGVSSFSADGSFATTSGSAGLSCTVFRPSTLGERSQTPDHRLGQRHHCLSQHLQRHS